MVEKALKTIINKKLMMRWWAERRLMDHTLGQNSLQAHESNRPYLIAYSLNLNVEK
jgi:hypothetical protein